MAKELGFTGAANMVVLAVYLRMSGVLSVDTLKQIIPVSIKRKQYIEVNLKAVEVAVRFCEEQLKEGSQWPAPSCRPTAGANEPNCILTLHVFKFKLLKDNGEKFFDLRTEALFET
jgi:hypothetical protein